MEHSLESLVQHVDRKFKNKVEMPRKIELYDLYITARFSTHTIARLYGTTNSVIMNWMSYYNIPTRSLAESQLHKDEKRLSKEELYQLYTVEKKQLKYIAEFCHVDKKTIYKWLDKYGIDKKRARSKTN